MAREGTIAYRTEDGNFQGRQKLQKETKQPAASDLTFFARFLLKNHLDEMMEGKPAQERS